MFVAAMADRVTIRRIISASALFAFVGAFFVVPLWPLLTLCRMPCCHQATPSAAMTAPMGCHTDCTVVAANDALAASTMVAPAQHDVATAPAVALVDVLRPALAAPDATGAPPPSLAAAPLHLLNSVFRI